VAERQEGDRRAAGKRGRRDQQHAGGAACQPRPR
jgi:hypothetical protein